MIWLNGSEIGDGGVSGATSATGDFFSGTVTYLALERVDTSTLRPYFYPPFPIAGIMKNKNKNKPGRRNSYPVLFLDHRFQPSAKDK